jgi:hypothetical protein
MTVLGVDIGNSALKLWGPEGGVYLPSIVASCVSRPMKTMYGLKVDRPPLRIKYNQGAFFVGSRAQNFGRIVQNYDFERLTGTPEVKALLYAGLTSYSQKYGVISEPVSCVVGLPLEYYKESEDKRLNPDEVRRWIANHHSWTADDDGFEVNIQSALPTSQSAGALFDFALDQEGKAIPAKAEIFKQEIGVISIGFGTVEIQVFNLGKAIDFRSDSSAIGMRRVIELMDPEANYSIPELDEKLRSGSLAAQGSLDIYFSELTGFIERKWDGKYWKRLSKIILVGGGAKYVGERLSVKYGINRVVIAEDPVMTIAHGLYKVGSRQKPNK